MPGLAITVSVALAAARATPGVRNAHALAFDEARGVVVLFGGADARAVRGDTWSWNGVRWKLASRAGPPARTFPAMAYDAARGRIVLFGGRRVLFGTGGEEDTFLGDTWAWDGAAWRQLAVAGPPARAEAAIAYDDRRGRVVLFGGYRDGAAGRQRFGDTWEWDGTAWTQVATTGPAARNGAAMAFDARRGRTVLFGGSGPPARGDTWEWDGARWEPIDPPAPGRFNSVAAYDRAREQIVRFGGWDGERRVNETWSYGAGAWTLLRSAGPPARNHTAVAYDRARGRIVLFGGHDGDRVFGDTWEWDGSAWRSRGGRKPERRVDNGH